MVKKNLIWVKKTEYKEVKESKTDPDSGLLHKNEKEKCFAYSFHTACDKRGFILGIDVTAANVHDSMMLEPLIEKISKNIGKPKYVVADAGYKTPYITKLLIDQGIVPVMPYTRPRTKDGYFRKHEYVYDEYYDCYICPNNQVLSYSTTNRDGYREYKSNSEICKTCPYLSKCTRSKNNIKVKTRHIWEEYIEEVNHFWKAPLEPFFMPFSIVKFFA